MNNNLIVLLNPPANDPQPPTPGAPAAALLRPEELSTLTAFIRYEAVVERPKPLPKAA